MHNKRKITRDLYFIGGSDRRIALFENIYPLENGVSYNSYLLTDEKTVLLDTVDNSISELFFENISAVLGGRSLNYVIVNHMEPDHAATLGEVISRYPDVKIVGNQKTLKLIGQFFGIDVSDRFISVKDGDSLSTGRHTLSFYMAPMVHWPEVMVTYDATDKILFSADAFGTFGALSGNIFADELNFKEEWLPEARRYYSNIVGKYGKQVENLLKKASKLDIAMLCPLHGPIWRDDINWFVSKYADWASYTPEEQGVLILCGSVYGHTENAAEYLAAQLAQEGVKNIKLYDVSKTHPSYLISEAFRLSHIVFASVTYNMGIFPKMDDLLNEICAHNLQNRRISIIENGSWAPVAGKLMRQKLEMLKNVSFLGETITLNSARDDKNTRELDELAQKIANTMEIKKENTEVNNDALTNLCYGLFVLSAKEGEKDNGCIINTVMQVTNSPNRIAVGVNKSNYTHGMIEHTGVFNISVLSQSAKFDTFKHFGFQSGADTDKFSDFPDKARDKNGIFRLTSECNSFISARVENVIDCGTHSIFIANVENSAVLNDEPSMTYSYYHEHIKPTPTANADSMKKKWVCKICGYVYEGDELPEDFVCPLCKHGAQDFEPIN